MTEFDILQMLLEELLKHKIDCQIFKIWPYFSDSKLELRTTNLTLVKEIRVADEWLDITFVEPGRRSTVELNLNDPNSIDKMIRLVKIEEL